MKRKYTAMLVFGTEYSGWLAQSPGVTRYPLTCAKSNIMWFRRRMDAYRYGCEVCSHFGGTSIKVKVTTEEEVDAYLVMRTIHESTFPRPS